MVLEVKRLLYDKRFTIEGARRHFEQNKKKGGAAKTATPASTQQPQTPEQPPPMQGMLFGAPAAPPGLDAIKQEIASILEFLNRKPVRAVR